LRKSQQHYAAVEAVVLIELTDKLIEEEKKLPEKAEMDKAECALNALEEA
jgi:hypothetical protein